jgi:cytochrome b6-f complex iron-sulfur subunit
MTGDKKNRADSETPSSRRSLLNWIWACLAAVAMGEILWIIVSFLRPRRLKSTGEDGDTIVKAGPVNGFDPGTVTAFPRGRFYLARLADGGFLALSRRCTHLGCTVPWVAEENQFICPCHSSVFDIKGAVVRSPASRALDVFPVTIENGIVRVNTRKAQRRSGFVKEQVVYP